MTGASRYYAVLCVLYVSMWLLNADYKEGVRGGTKRSINARWRSAMGDVQSESQPTLPSIEVTDEDKIKAEEFKQQANDSFKSEIFDMLSFTKGCRA